MTVSNLNNEAGENHPEDYCCVLVLRIEWDQVTGTELQQIMAENNH